MIELRSFANRRFVIVLGTGILTLVAIYYASFLPTADWSCFYAAGQNVLSGQSPYPVPGFALPPWGILPILPLVLLPYNLSHGLMFVISAFILIFIMWRLRLPPLAAAAFLLSPTTIGALLVNNVDPFVITGILFPPVWGLFLLVMKPQIGFGLVIYYLVDAWKIGRFSKIIKTFAPVSAFYLLSLLLFPAWLDTLLHYSQNAWNRSIFPFGIPFGILLLWLAIRKRNPYFALASAPFFSPYLTYYTYFVVQIGLMHPDVEKYIRRDLLQIILFIFLWVIMFTVHP